MLYGVLNRALYIGPRDLLLIIVPCESPYTLVVRIGKWTTRNQHGQDGYAGVSQKSTSRRRAARVRAVLQALIRAAIAERARKKGPAALDGPLANTKLLFLYRGAKMFTAFALCNGIRTSEGGRGPAGKKRKTELGVNISLQETYRNGEF